MTTLQAGYMIGHPIRSKYKLGLSQFGGSGAICATCWGVLRIMLQSDGRIDQLLSFS
jgi:hypothetical protein